MDYCPITKARWSVFSAHCCMNSEVSQFDSGIGTITSVVLCARHCHLSSFCVVLSSVEGLFPIVMCSWILQNLCRASSFSLCGNLSSHSLSHKLWPPCSLQILCSISTQEVGQLFPWFAFPVQQTWNSLKGLNWASCRDHPICFPSLRDQYPLSPDCQCLCKTLFHYFVHFLVVSGGRLHLVNPSCPEADNSLVIIILVEWDHLQRNKYIK